MNQNLFQALTQGGHTQTVGMVTLVVLGRGRGAFVAPVFDVSVARKWAEGRDATGIEYRDMTQFMDRFELLIARSGCSLVTRGHPIKLVELAKEMKSSGYELSEWSLPQAVMDELKPKRPQPGQPAPEADAESADDNETKE